MPEPPISNDVLATLSLSDVPLGVVPFDMYVVRPGTRRPVLYCKQGETITEKNLDRLRERRISEVLIHQREGDSPPRSRRASSTPERIREIHRVHGVSFERLFQNGSTDELVGSATEMAAEIVDAISASANLRFADLHGLMAHDRTTFTHCLNVCVYCISLARALGIGDASELLQIGIGGLLHDMGKRSVPKQVINKPGRLSSSEASCMATHPVTGFREVSWRDDLRWGTLMMIYQHHEHIDGSGYPVGVPKAEIHIHAQICSVADVFHALTSERSYHMPMSIGAACAYLQQQAGKTLSRDLVNCWIDGVRR